MQVKKSPEPGHLILSSSALATSLGAFPKNMLGKD